MLNGHSHLLVIKFYKVVEIQANDVRLNLANVGDDVDISAGNFAKRFQIMDSTTIPFTKIPAPFIPLPIPLTSELGIIFDEDSITTGSSVELAPNANNGTFIRNVTQEVNLSFRLRKESNIKLTGVAAIDYLMNFAFSRIISVLDVAYLYATTGAIRVAYFSPNATMLDGFITSFAHSQVGDTSLTSVSMTITRNDLKEKMQKSGMPVTPSNILNMG